MQAIEHGSETPPAGAAGSNPGSDGASGGAEAAESQDCGAEGHPALLALCSLARLHHVAADPATLSHQLGWPPSHRPSLDDLLLAARHLGLKARRSRTSADRLPLSPLPALAVMRPASHATEELETPADAPHVVLLAQCDGQRVLIQDPSGRLQGGRPVIEPLSRVRRPVDRRADPRHQPRQPGRANWPSSTSPGSSPPRQVPQAARRSAAGRRCSCSSSPWSPRCSSRW